MTDIVELALNSCFKVSCEDTRTVFHFNEHGIKLFAARIANECAKTCEEHPDGLNMMGGAFVTCAAAIREKFKPTS